MTIADTDVLIDFLTGKDEADRVEELLRRGALRTTVITRFQLLSGARNAKQLGRLQQLLAAVPSLELDDDPADTASDIRQSLERTGDSIAMADSPIAGIVNSNAGTPLTRNRCQFEKVASLRLA